MSDQPNVLLMISDQHNAKCLGVADHPQVRTPHLDRLATEGIQFTRAVTNSPICAPSRIGYLTGQYSHNHGHYGNLGPRPDRLPSLLGHLQRAGYKTASIGHINSPLGWQHADTDYMRDVYPGELAAGVESWWCEYDDYLAEKGLQQDRDDLFFPEQENGPQFWAMDGRPPRLSYEHSIDAWCARETMKFIKECDDQPWFAYLAYPHPHSIYAPAPQFWNLYDEENIWLPPNADYDMSLKSPHLRAMRAWWENHPDQWTLFEPRTYEAGRKRKQRGYLGCISQVDRCVGDMLDFLDSTGLRENTIIVYTADHGDYACEHGIIEKAPGICGDAICRVPSIWSWRGRFAEGHVCSQHIQNVDLAPTLVSLLGQEPMYTCDGEDMTPLLQGKNSTLHEFEVTEHPWSKSILKGDWRLVYYPQRMFADEMQGQVFGELYDLAKDPWEMENLYFRSEHRDRVRELERDLLDWLVTTTRIRTVLPHVAPRDRSGGEYDTRLEADGKISWRDVAGVRTKNYL